MRAIDVRDLLENPGASRTVRVEEPVPGLRTELADVPEDAPIAADLTLESVVEGIYVRGSLEGRFVMRCARFRYRNLGECPGHERVDPRWEALGVLLEDLSGSPDHDD